MPPTLGSHRAADYTKQERADTLIPIALFPHQPPAMKQLFKQKLYIIGNKLGQTKMKSIEAGGTYPQFSQKTEQCLPGEIQGPHPVNHNRSTL